MRWFQRHLNWAYLFGLLILCALFAILAQVSSREIGGIIAFAGIILLTIWVLKQKHRSWVYVFVLLIPIPVIGWAIIMGLENWSEVTDIVDGKVITRPREKND